MDEIGLTGFCILLTGAVAHVQRGLFNAFDLSSDRADQAYQ